MNPPSPKDNTDDYGQANDYYNAFYKQMTDRKRLLKGTSELKALDALPKDGLGRVNWTVAVVDGYINPRNTIEPGAPDESDIPLDLNIFIEAKTPLMANVLFPHSIHTYWLSCNICHPKIFIPEAGANPISMEEIWQGKWCGRCHGKRANCVRCHIVLKGRSLEKEHFN
ncbi:MAG: c(7)-type cytochrome triheme domain-containing protein [Thermodesulfobacteriota bacterium]